LSAPPSAPVAPPRRVLHVASEIAPFSATGGLGMVVGSLPAHQRAAGLGAHVVTPLYRFIERDALVRGAEAPTVRLDGQTWTGRRWHTPDGHVTFLDVPKLFDRPHAYGPPGHAYDDNPLRFAVFCRMAAQMAETTDVFHLHDWQAALTAVYLGGRRPAVLTVHNLAYRGLCGLDWADRLGVPRALRTFEGVEYHGQMSLLKAGLVLADRLTTVSPRYADEIQSEPGGAGLSGLFRHRRSRLSGILNGIDVESWDPADDAALAAPFDADDVSGRDACRAALRATMHLDEGVLFGAATRATPQKGIDLVLPEIDRLVAVGARFAFVADGDPDLMHALRAAAARHPRAVALVEQFHPTLLRQLYAGTDFTLVPSRFEPCGLAQMYAMRYGSVPVVRQVGGLADTVRDAEDGITFFDPSVAGFGAAADRAMALFEAQDAYRAMQRNALRRDWSWDGPATAYDALYASLSRSPTGARR
jgi:starch synthase